MLYFLQSLFSNLFFSKSSLSNDALEIDEEKVLEELNAEVIEEDLLTKDSLPVPKEPFGQSEPQQYNVEVFKYVNKVGKVTHFTQEYGLIDDIIYFEPSQVDVGLTLVKGALVKYKAYKANENESERVFKIYALNNDSWDEEETPDQFNKYSVENEVTALSRIITGRVIKRKGRECLVEPVNVWCNLDSIEATFVPVEGDWVSLEASVSVSDETVDLVGEVLDIKSLKPLLAKTGIGRISFWSKNKGEGVIENLIYFSQIICDNGYIPNLGDEVSYDAIESDQESYKWRAVKVVPNEVFRKQNSFFETQQPSFCNKHGISINPSLHIIDIGLNETKTVIFEVTNTGSSSQLLQKTKFNTRKNESQLTLKSPRLNDSITIPPNTTINYTFNCKGRFLGLNKETFVFYFKDFIIKKIFEINVGGNKEMDKLLSCKGNPVFRVVENKKFIRDTADGTLYGPRPWKRPKFSDGEKRGVYNMPDKLLEAVIGDLEFPKKKSESIKDLEKYAPYLKENLNFSHYVERFHTLLYLEEIEMKKNFRRYDMNGVFLLRKGEYLVLEVPGLVEQRPSLLVGDKVMVTQPWSEANEIKQIGYIYEIHQKDIFIKFHDSFHKCYDESDCDVVFLPCLVTINRCHDAVNRSASKLGPKWLFPSAVNEKPPAINFEVVEEVIETEENEVKMSGKTIHDSPPPLTCVNGLQGNEMNKVKKLTWYNKILNERQKMAIVNALKAKGRPLPYIIFGPPGTGKTITLVELAMQIYHLEPASRLLIASPSNSSADLICERLIDSGNFKPGQLVRLMAFHRAAEGNVNPKLVPYCTAAEAKDDNSKFFTLLKDTNYRMSRISQLAGRHRLTVGTCGGIGALHYLGFPPGHFTHILIDEAGQASEPELLIPATFQNATNSQIVLTGDPQQLGPICISMIANKYGFGVSLLQRFVSTFPYTKDFDAFPETSGYDPRFITRLNVNYRSIPEILSLPSQMFYNSDLIPTVSETEGREADIVQKFNFESEGRDRPPAIIFHGILGANYQENDSPSWYNPHEVWQGVTYLRKCYEIGLTCEDIGIVTPYLKQVQKFRYLLTALNLSLPKIGTIEDFQGQERYVIIVSTVRSSLCYLGSDISHSLGFVGSPRRLNVALTRARALVIILGNPLLLSKDPYWKNVVDYCIKNKSYTGYNLDDNSEAESEE